MINTFETKIGQSVLLFDLYQFLELRIADYSRFVKINILNNHYLVNEKDYYACMRSENLGKKGKFRQDYYIHIDKAKILCMVSNSAKGNQVREYLLQLTKDVENKKLLSQKEVIDLINIVQVFAVYEFRKESRQRNEKNFVEKLQDSNLTQNQKFASFNNFRNEVLGTGKEVLAKRIKEFCLLNERNLPKEMTQDNILVILGKYEHIKNAVWDLLSSKNKSNEFAENIARFAQEIAVAIKPFAQRLNTSDLFFKEIDAQEVQYAGLSF